MEASEPKWVNPNNIQYGVNSLRLGGLHILPMKCTSTTKLYHLKSDIPKTIFLYFLYRNKNISFILFSSRVIVYIFSHPIFLDKSIYLLLLFLFHKKILHCKDTYSFSAQIFSVWAARLTCQKNNILRCIWHVTEVLPVHQNFSVNTTQYKLYKWVNSLLNIIGVWVN